MSRWYQVYDDERVNLSTRRLARRLATALVALGLGTLAFILVVIADVVSIYPVTAMLAGLWGWAGTVLLVRWRALRRQVWCVKISDREIVGYDCRRQLIRVDWVDAVEVNVRRAGMVISGPGALALEVPAGYADYTGLCHFVLGQAEFYGIPVSVEGQNLSQISASDLFPFLDELGSSPK